jgi:hypothetical protein
MRHPGHARLDLPHHFSHAIEKAQLACSGDARRRPFVPDSRGHQLTSRGHESASVGHDLAGNARFGQLLLTSLGKGALVKPRFSSSPSMHHAAEYLLQVQSVHVPPRVGSCSTYHPHTPLPIYANDGH